MKINEAFPSKYLKAADLEGHAVKVIMDRVLLENVGDDEPKPVLYFQGKQKGIVLNKTNANNISRTYGNDTDAWKGKPLELFEAMVDFRGETVAAIRVRVPNNSAPQRPAPAREHSELDPPPADDVPF